MARADVFEVNPISVALAPSAKSADIVITNHGNAETRFSLSGYAWAESPTEQMRLAPSDDLLFFPQIFTVAPGASQRVRIGVTQPAHASDERAYRLYVSQLPPFQPKGGPGVNLSIISRVGIPVFQLPVSEGAVASRIDSATVSDGHISVVVSNEGTLHLAPSTATVRAYDSAGAAIWSATPDVWYVLAHSSQTFTATIPRAQCLRAAALIVTWNAPDGERSRTLKLHGGECR